MLKADWTPQNAKETYERDSHSPNQTAPVPQTARTHYPACKSPKTHHRRTCFLCDNISGEPLLVCANWPSLLAHVGKVCMATQSPHGNCILSECLSYLCDLLFIWNHYLKCFFQRLFTQYLVFKKNIYMYVSLFLNVIVKPQLQSYVSKAF